MWDVFECVSLILVPTAIATDNMIDGVSDFVVEFDICPLINWRRGKGFLRYRSILRTSFRFSGGIDFPFVL